MDRKNSTSKWVKDVEEILRQDNVRELLKDLTSHFDFVSQPNEEAEDALDTIFNKCLETKSPIEAMWCAFVFGAAWQVGIGKEG